MTERELTLFSAMTDIGDNLVLESGAFVPALGGTVGSAVGGTAAAASAGKRAAWVLPVTLASCAALVAAVGIAVGVVGNAFGFFPSKPPEVTTEEGTTEDATADLPAEGEEYLVSFVINGYPAAPPAPQRVKAGRCAVEPAVEPFDDGGRFDGWYTAEDRGADSRFDFSTPITADMALYGAWIPMTDTPTEELTDTPTEPSTEAEPETEETTEETTEVSTPSEDDTPDTQPMPETVRDALTTYTDILHSTMVSWQRNLENVTVERVMDAIDRIEAASEFFGATNEGGYYLEVRDGNVYLCRKIVYPIHDGAEEGSQILSELLGEKS